MLILQNTTAGLVGVFSTELMILLWGLVIAVSFYTAYKTKLLGLMIIGGGAMPMFIFHVYNIFGVWEGNYWTAVFYSRMSQVSLVISILLSLWFMYNRMVKKI